MFGMPVLIVLIISAFAGLFYFLAIKRRGCLNENLTSAYNVRLKKNKSKKSRPEEMNFFYKTANALLTGLFFAGYFLIGKVTAVDHKYTDKYNDDNHFKYNVTLYSPGKAGLPADCPPKMDINQIYPQNKLLAITDCPGGFAQVSPCAQAPPFAQGSPFAQASPFAQMSGPFAQVSPFAQMSPAGVPMDCTTFSKYSGGAWANWSQISWGRWMPWVDFGQYQHWSQGGPYDSIPGYNDSYTGHGTPCPGGGTPPPWNQGIPVNPNPSMCGLCGTPSGGGSAPSAPSNPSMCGLCGMPQ